MSIPFFNLAFNPIIETNCNIRSKKLEERYNFIHANLFTRRSRETLHKCVTIILARRQIRNARRYCKEHIVGAIDRLEDHCQLTIPLDEKIQKNRDTLPPVARERGHWPVFSIVADIVNISPGHLSLCLLYLSTTLHDHPAPLSSPRATNVGKGKGQWSDGKEGRGRNIARRETSEQRWIKGVGDEVEWECVVSVPPRALPRERRRFSPNYYARGEEKWGREEASSLSSTCSTSSRGLLRGREEEFPSSCRWSSIAEERCASAPLHSCFRPRIYIGLLLGHVRSCCNSRYFYLDGIFDGDGAWLRFVARFWQCLEKFVVIYIYMYSCCEKLISQRSLFKQDNEQVTKVLKCLSCESSESHFEEKWQLWEKVDRKHRPSSRDTRLLKDHFVSRFSRRCQFKWRFVRGKALFCFSAHFATRPNKMTSIQGFRIRAPFPNFSHLSQDNGM